jgi:hypothetical protein
LAKAFVEQIQPCKISCDYCVNPKAVQEGIEVAKSHRNETSDNFRSSRKNMLKKIEKAAKHALLDDNSAIPKGEPAKKVLKFDVNKRKAVYVDEEKRKINTLRYNF